MCSHEGIRLLPESPLSEEPQRGKVSFPAKPSFFFLRSRCVITAAELCRFILSSLFFGVSGSLNSCHRCLGTASFITESIYDGTCCSCPDLRNCTTCDLSTHLLLASSNSIMLFISPSICIELPSALLITQGYVHFCFICPRSSDGSHNGEHRSCQRTAGGVGSAVRKAV